MPTVIGLYAALEIKTVEMVYSFHALIKTYISVVTIPGAAIGIKTRVNAPTVSQPSIKAACSISDEIDTNVPRNSQIAKA